MIPRMSFDISWTDLGAGLVAALVASDRAALAAQAEAALRPNTQSAPRGGAGISGANPADCCTLAFLSVRSGFSATLAALALPAGSRIAFSGITIKDMPRIAQHHGLQVDAFDVDPLTLAPCLTSLARTVTAETKIIVVAHLFGSRTDLTPVHQFAAQRGILVFEDCAQAYTGDGWCGHDASDVALFSFGPIKTATALGGAIIRYKSPELRAASANVQSRWPAQSQLKFAQRVLKFAGLSFLSLRPVFTAFTAVCDAMGKDWDALIAQSARGFSGGEFFSRIHTQPCAALLSLLNRRLRQQHGPRMAQRAAVAQRVLDSVPTVQAPGRRAQSHSHWVLPLEFADPTAAAYVLRLHGFDATKGTSSMTVIGDHPEQAAPLARHAESRWLYVPCHARMSHSDRQRLAAAVAVAARSPSQTQENPSSEGSFSPSSAPPSGAQPGTGHTPSAQPPVHSTVNTHT